jgi:hypothetical protein
MVAPHEPLAATHPTIPRDVAALVDRCLSFEAEERPTAADAAAVLREASFAPVSG